jgi:hypothetical protein
MFGNPPHPSVQAHREAATRISQAMRAAGWEVIGRGSAWYDERYVWRGAEEPAERIALPDGPAAPDEPRGGGTT